jgi:hypothetical protein
LDAGEFGDALSDAQIGVGAKRGAEGPLQLGEKLGAGEEAVFCLGHQFEDIGCLNHVEPVESFGEALLVCHVVPSLCCVCLIFGIYATDKLNATTEIDMSLKKRERGRPKGRVQDKQLLMRVTAEFLETVDKWRKEQPDVLTRSDAIRRLVERGLKYRGK